MVGIDLDHASKHLDLSTLDTVDSPLIEREPAERHSSGTPSPSRRGRDRLMRRTLL